ncbi:hypothetical protein SBA4_1460004 [Candidatus Sulfopaludibacter sp. SbA4]|nr:hypothetical protein SBA4_1460004 [Candidatus Sulfopaludibacter sp. SbA4]
MGIGHVAVGLSLKPADRRLNVGLLIFAAFLANFLLGWFVWAGWESYQYPPDFASVHYMLFTFPWSHGLLPLVVWATCLGLLIRAFRRQTRAGPGGNRGSLALPAPRTGTQTGGALGGAATISLN